MFPTDQIEQQLGLAVEKVTPLAGGDICQAYKVRFEDGTSVFVKTKPGGPKDMFSAEAFGLRWLAETGALRIPEVVAATETFLALELLESGPKRSEFDEDWHPS